MRNKSAILLSQRIGKAVTLRNTSPVQIENHALQLTLIQMPGEQNTLWAFSAKQKGKDAIVKVVADPRNQDDNFEILTCLLDTVLIPYITTCCNDLKQLPQIIVCNSSAQKLLKIMAILVRSQGAKKELEDLAYKGNYLSLLTQELHEPRQPIIVNASDILNQLFAVPMPQYNAQHLGATLAWIENNNESPLETVKQATNAADHPSSIHLLPETDAILEPIVSEIGKIRKKFGSDAPSWAKHSIDKQQIELAKVIKPELESMSVLLEKAFEVITAFDASPAAKAVYSEYHNSQISRDFEWLVVNKGHLKGKAKTSPDATNRLIQREAVRDSNEAAYQKLDFATTEHAISNGEVIAGTIVDVLVQNKKVLTNGRQMRRKQLVYLNVLTEQSELRARAGDTRQVSHPWRGSVEICGKEAEQNQRGYYVLCEVKDGIRTVKSILDSGKEVSLIGQPVVLTTSAQSRESKRVENSKRKKLQSAQLSRISDLKKNSKPELPKLIGNKLPLVNTVAVLLKKASEGAD